MKIYNCSKCGNPLYFENSICLSCNNKVGFDPDLLSFVTLVESDNDNYADIKNPQNKYRFCKNAAESTCNWLIQITQENEFCKACALNRTIPSLINDDNRARWQRIEIAKHRLIYSLIRLKLPFKPKINNDDEGLAFDFITESSPNEKIMTGHINGVITLNTEEADEIELIRHKIDLGERYRTLLGHFRHETGHFYWNILLNEKTKLKKFRLLFGDEQKDYSLSLQGYYQSGAPVNWNEYFISPYASSHPWEDWAETWAHYMHMMDTLETAYQFGINIQPNKKRLMAAQINNDPYKIRSFNNLLNMWIPFTFSANSLNRSMGYADFYPFIISETVKKKLEFIHTICNEYRSFDL